MELLLPLATASLPNPLLPPIAVFPNPTHRLSSFRVAAASRRAVSTSPGGFPSPFPRSLVVSVSNCVDTSVSSSTGWVVVTETPPGGSSSKSEVVDYYVGVLARVLGSVKEAQMRIYDVSWQNHYGFCCDVNEEASRWLADVPGVLSVRPDKDIDSAKKDYSFLTSPSSQFSSPNNHYDKFTPAAPGQNSNYWLVQMEKPRIEIVTKAQMVDYYAQTLTKVMGNEKDAQMSMYHISWEEEFGFCCHIDEDCARELADIRGVLAVCPDLNVNSDYKDYRGVGMTHKSLNSTPVVIDQMPKTKRLFVTGLSFYTSEKTLRAAFEGYGELVEVKIIMDKISKRSKGYAFIEYTTEEAAGAALREMNGKIINGWMIVVDVAKTNPPRQNRGRIRHPTPPSQNYL